MKNKRGVNLIMVYSLLIIIRGPAILLVPVQFLSFRLKKNRGSFKKNIEFYTVIDYNKGVEKKSKIF